jgi:hypothetical protein
MPTTRTLTNQVLQRRPSLTTSSADSLYGDLVYVDEGDGWCGIGKAADSENGKFNPRGFLNGWMPPHPTFFLANPRTIEHGSF